jgi:hypothetical protein
MERSKIGPALTHAGILVLAISVVWFLLFWGAVHQKLAANDRFPIDQIAPCLVYSSHACLFINLVAKANGYFAYEPIVFWIGAGLTAVGLMAKASSTQVAPAAAVVVERRPPASPGSSPKKSEVLSKWDILISVDPEIEKHANMLRKYGPDAVAELGEKYLILMDKAYLPRLVEQIAARHGEADNAARQLEPLKLMLSKVNLIYRTPWGCILELKSDRSAVAQVNGDIKRFRSFADFHVRQPGQQDGWREVASEADKIEFAKTNFNLLQHAVDLAPDLIMSGGSSMRPADDALKSQPLPHVDRSAANFSATPANAVEKEFKSVFAIKADSDRERMVAAYMQDRGLTRSEAMQLLIDQWRRDNRTWR